jgi:hypothetical protein
MENWGVWEYETGVLWNVTPPTEKRALEEAELAGPGHTAVTTEEGYRLQNAWAFGRMNGIRQMRGW